MAHLFDLYHVLFPPPRAAILMCFALVFFSLMCHRRCPSWLYAIDLMVHVPSQQAVGRKVRLSFVYRINRPFTENRLAVLVAKAVAHDLVEEISAAEELKATAVHDHALRVRTSDGRSAEDW